MFYGSLSPENMEKHAKELTEKDKESFERAQNMRVNGSAYAVVHGTRPATIGLALSTSPLALLAWYVHPFQSQRIEMAHMKFSLPGLGRSSLNGAMSLRPWKRSSQA
jgi:hypothetical protein